MISLQDPIMLGTCVLLLALAVTLLLGKGSGMIAGYNTMSKEKQ